MEHFCFHSSSKVIETAIQNLVTRTGHLATATATVAKASARVASNTMTVARASGRVASNTMTVAKASSRVATVTMTVARASARIASNTMTAARTKTQVGRLEGKKQRPPKEGKQVAFCAFSSPKEVPLGKAHGQLLASLMPEKHRLHPSVPGLALFAY